MIKKLNLKLIWKDFFQFKWSIMTSQKNVVQLQMLRIKNYNMQGIRQLETCIVNILEMATILGTDSVSIPAISTGIYSFPKELCASIMIERVS